MKKGVQVFLMIAIFILAFITYSNHFRNAFHFDDSHTIVNNEYIRSLKNIPLFFSDARTFSSLPANQTYRPGLTTLNAVDTFFSPGSVPDPFPFHVSIFICHIVSGIFVYLIVLHLLSAPVKTKWNQLLALFSVAWFLLHTANAETINYVIARSDSFSTLMILIAFTIYLYCPSSRKWYLYLIPMVIGFSVKEQAIMFVPILLVYQLLFEEEDAAINTWFKKEKMIRSLKKIIAPLLVAILLFAFSRMMVPDTWTSGSSSRWPYLFTQPFVILHYVYNFILPVNLVVDTDWRVVPSYTDDRVFAGLLFILAMVYAIYKSSQHENYKGVAFGLCWFLFALIPTSSIFPFAEVLNDHRTFFPYIGLFISVAVLLKNVVMSSSFQQNRFASVLLNVSMMLLLGLHAYGAHQQNKVWHTEESLWKEATLKAPNNERAWMNYGITQMEKGNYAEAENCFNTTKALAPGYSYVYINLGIVKQHTNRYNDAEADFKQALLLNAYVPEAYAYYGKYLLHINRVSEAVTIIDKGLDISPAHPVLKELKSAIQQSQLTIVDPISILKEAEKVVTQVPTADNYLNLSLAYYNAAQYDSCIVAAEQALKSNPSYDLAYNNICAAYNKLKEWSKAIEAGEKGLKLNPNNQLLKGNLDVAYKEKAGR